MTTHTLGRICIIEDEPLILSLYREIFTMWNYEVVTGSSGADLDRCLGEDIVGIICDQTLPGESGLQIHARLRDELVRRRIAFLLVHGQDVHAFPELHPGELLKLGVIGLNKPIGMPEIEAALRAEIARLRS